MQHDATTKIARKIKRPSRTSTNPELKGDNIFATKILRKALRLGGIVLVTFNVHLGLVVRSFHPFHQRLGAWKVKKDLALGS